MELSVYDSVENGIRERFGSNVSVVSKNRVGGGDINDAFVLQLSNGEKAFMKTNSVSNKDFFKEEARGIRAIASTETIRTPDLFFRGADEKNGYAFLVMEYIGSAGRCPDFWSEFGRSLAAMHLADTSSLTGSGRYGFMYDNYIGASKQINEPRDSWICFFAECRLEIQFDMAKQYFDETDKKKILRLLERLPVLLSEPERPSLLHGDLWSGNYMIGNDGKAWLIDPAVYVGHAEADLAMTELFGRFPSEFYKAYSEVNPIDPGYNDRRDLYNLYHLLNHLNLFGSTYLSAVMSTVEYYS